MANGRIAGRASKRLRHLRSGKLFVKWRMTLEWHSKIVQQRGVRTGIWNA